MSIDILFPPCSKTSNSPNTDSRIPSKNHCGCHPIKPTSSEADSDTHSATSPASDKKRNVETAANTQRNASTRNALKPPYPTIALSSEDNRSRRIPSSSNHPSPGNRTTHPAIPSPATSSSSAPPLTCCPGWRSLSMKSVKNASDSTASVESVNWTKSRVSPRATAQKARRFTPPKLKR